MGEERERVAILPASMATKQRRRRDGSRFSASAVLLLAFLPSAAGGEEPGRQEPDSPTEERRPLPWAPDWSGRVDVNLTSSSGNAASRSVGIGAEATREISRIRLALDGAVLRASTGEVVRRAVGTPDDFEILSSVRSQVSADRSHLRARVSEAGLLEGSSAATGLHFFGAAGWERDGAAGVSGRYEVTAGVEVGFGETSNRVMKPVEFGAGLSFLHQRDEVNDPDVGDTTVGLRVDGRSAGTIGAAEVSLVTASTWNLRTRDDLRLDVTGAIAMPVTARLAFRSSAQVLYDTRPALERVPLSLVEGGDSTGRVVTPRARGDLILLIALSWRF